MNEEIITYRADLTGKYLHVGTRTTIEQRRTTEAARSSHRALQVYKWRQLAKQHHWCTDAPVGEWFGIFTLDNGAIWSIALPDNNLCGTLPEELGNISSLGSLEVGVNDNLRGTLPESIGYLKDFQNFNATGCNLEGAIPESYKNMTKMKSFRISHNHITSIPDGLGESWPDLQSLYLDLNDITELQSGLGNCMDDLTDMRELGQPISLQIRYEHNKLTGKLPEDITGHRNWEYVWQEIITQKEGYGLDLRGVDLPCPAYNYYDMNGGRLNYKEVAKASKHTLVIEIDRMNADDTYRLEDLNKFYHKYHKDGLDMIFETAGRTTSGYDCHMVNLTDPRNM